MPTQSVEAESTGYTETTDAGVIWHVAIGRMGLLGSQGKKEEMREGVLVLMGGEGLHYLGEPRLKSYFSPIRA